MQEKTHFGTLLSVLALIMALMLVPTLAVADEAPPYAYVSVEMPLYEQADAQSPLITTVNAGTWLCVDEQGDAFCRVSLTDGTVGYAAAEFLLIANPAAANEGAVTNDGRYVNLRQGPGTKKKVLEKVPDGTALTVSSHQNGWYAVTVGDKEGYMADTMVTVGPKAVSFKYIHANNGKPVNMRTAPNTEGDIIASLPEGTELDVLIAGTDWDWVRARGKLGFLASSFTSERDESEQIPLSYTYGYVVLNNPTSFLHVRAAPDVSSQTLASYHVGTKMKILSADDHFAEVSVGKVHGYVQAKYLKAHKKYYDKLNEEPHYNADGYIEATLINPNGGDVVNFRDNPSMQSNVLSAQSVGLEVEVFSKGKDFCKVRLGGEWGYIKTEFLWFK